MLKSFLTSVICFASAFVLAQSNPANPNETLISTEVLPNNQVAFRIYAPDAKEVKLKSDDKRDKVDFQKDSLGVWEGIWSNVQPGAYRYRFVVDGVNVYDPKAPSARETTALLLMTSGDDFFAMKEEVPHGGITQRYYYSRTLKQMRRLHVWTPAGFEKSTEDLPVLYLIHGGGDTDLAWPTIGCAGNILDNLLSEGKIKPMIVVMPNGTIQTDNILDRVPLFTEDLMTDILPIIESTYPVHTDAAHRAIMGLSMGGLETLEAISYHPDRFGYIGVLSSGWWISDTWIAKRGMADDKAKRVAQLKQIAPDWNESVKLLYFTQGGPEDLAYENGMETLALFDAAGIPYQYSESPGGHTWKVWRNNLRDLAPLLFN